MERQADKQRNVEKDKQTKLWKRGKEENDTGRQKCLVYGNQLKTDKER